ncbi:MAG: glycoside hydrolase family 140 protein, partial [Prevotellaceae bacterium]|nr:glycoside hydrolase family 140 protein [Prevotellaceae bacterium]
LDAEGAAQMQHLKNLMLSRPFLERVPDSSLVANQGSRYDHVEATRGERYAFLYTYTGRELKVNMGKIKGSRVKATWYNPRSGEATEAGTVGNEGTASFAPPTPEAKEGNDWVLVLDAT